jgi:uncharacterized protein YybS (DUF2232 family)
MKEHSGVAIAVAACVVFFCLLLPAVIVTLVYLFGTVYAIVKGAGVGGRSPNAATVLIAIVVIVSTLVTLLYCGIGMIGRSMDPKRRAER